MKRSCFWLVGLLLIFLPACAVPTQTTQAVIPTGVPVSATLSPEAAHTQPAPSATAVRETETPLPTLVNTPGEMPPCTQIGQSWVSPVDGMTMLCVPAGEFLMGIDPATVKNPQQSAQPQHRVALDAFWVDQTEVTNTMYGLCVESGACGLPVESQMDYYTNPENHDFPVVGIIRKDAIAYCEWADRQLPSEAQWEKAARGVDGRLYPWGDERLDCTRANVRLGSIGPSCGNDVLQPVNTYPAGASPYGAQDMIGNAAELVLDRDSDDFYSRSPYHNPVNLEPGATSWIMRGGSWYSMPYANSAAGRDFYRGGADGMTGFRCVYNDPNTAALPSATPIALARDLYLTSPVMNGEDVFALQVRLADLGYTPGTIDGIFGAKTDAAVRAFQQRNSLTVDGWVGPKTWAALFGPDAAAFGYSEIAFSIAKTIQGTGPYIEASNGKVWAFNGAEIVVTDIVNDATRVVAMIAIQPLFKGNGKVWVPTTDAAGWGVLGSCNASGSNCSTPVDFSQKPGFELGESVIYGVDAGSYLWVLRDTGLYAMSYDFTQVLNHPGNAEPINALGFDGSRLWLAGSGGLRVLEGGNASLLYTVDLPHISAFAYDGVRMWALDRDRSQLIALDPQNGTVVGAIRPCERLDGIAYSDGLLWVSCFDKDQILGLQVGVE